MKKLLSFVLLGSVATSALSFEVGLDKVSLTGNSKIDAVAALACLCLANHQLNESGHLRRGADSCNPIVDSVMRNCANTVTLDAVNCLVDGCSFSPVKMAVKTGVCTAAEMVTTMCKDMCPGGLLNSDWARCLAVHCGMKLVEKQGLVK